MEQTARALLGQRLYYEGGAVAVDSAGFSVRIRPGGSLAIVQGGPRCVISPVALRWSNGEEIARADAAARPVPLLSQPQILVRRAFGDAGRIVFEFSSDGKIQKNVVVYHRELCTPPGAEALEVVFSLEYGEKQNLKVGGAAWGGEPVTTDSPLAIGSLRIPSPKAWGAGRSGKTATKCRMRLWRDGGRTFIAKLIPVEWAHNLTSPITADYEVELC